MTLDDLHGRHVTVPSTVLVRELDGESVLLNLDSEQYFGLDAVGTRMWQVLTESATVDAAYDQLLGEYDVDADTLASDLVGLLQQLDEQGLLVLAPQAGS